MEAVKRRKRREKIITLESRCVEYDGEPVYRCVAFALWRGMVADGWHTGDVFETEVRNRDTGERYFVAIPLEKEKIFCDCIWDYSSGIRVAETELLAAENGEKISVTCDSREWEVLADMANYLWKCVTECGVYCSSKNSLPDTAVPLEDTWLLTDTVFRRGY